MPTLLDLLAKVDELEPEEVIFAKPDWQAMGDQRQVPAGVESPGIGEREPLAPAQAETRRDEKDAHSLTMVEADVAMHNRR